RGAIFQNLDRPPPRQFLSVVDLTQIQHVPLHHAPAGDACVLDNAPVAMLLAILLADFAAQEHDGRQLSAYWRRYRTTCAALQPICGDLAHGLPWRSNTCSVKIAKRRVESAKTG